MWTKPSGIFLLMVHAGLLNLFLVQAGCSGTASLRGDSDIGVDDVLPDTASDAIDVDARDAGSEPCEGMMGTPCGPYYTSCPFPAWMLRVEVGPGAHGAAPVRVFFEAVLPDGCWEGGPLIPHIDDAARVVSMTLVAWHLMESPCTEETVHVERSALLVLSAGSWIVTDPSSGWSVAVDVLPCDSSIDECTCADPVWPVDEPFFGCSAGCQCASPLACLPINAMERQCLESCSMSEDCTAGTCVDSLADAGPIRFCAEGGASCTSDVDCRSGHVCSPFDDGGTRCLPEMRLDGSTRHPCSCNADCEEPGLDCVLESWPGGSGDSRCNVRCLTRHGTWCSGAHTCDEVSIEPYDRPVCGWVGE